MDARKGGRCVKTLPPKKPLIWTNLKIQKIRTKAPTLSNEQRAARVKKNLPRIERALRRAAFIAAKKHGRIATAASSDEMRQAYVRIFRHAEKLGWVRPRYEFRITENKK